MNAFQSYLRHVDTQANLLSVCDFPEDAPWFNSPPLSFKRQLNGKITLLHFWTYSCVNCLHLLPQLEALAASYAHAPVAVISVHTPKFPNEASSEMLRQAILRCDVRHPVVADFKRHLWDALGVAAWPTLAVVGPEGNLLFLATGEGHARQAARIVAEALDFYKARGFNALELTPNLEIEKTPLRTALKFPGKIAVDGVSKQLAISNSADHRVLLGTLDGQICATVGSGKAGHKDGAFEEAAFSRPQGIAFAGDTLFVADAGNHALRAIDLVERSVRTLIDWKSYGQGCSPWDVAVSQSHLYIALAGAHQIWSYDLQWGKFQNACGNGQATLRDGDDLLAASFAEPSGLAAIGNLLFVADSQSSTLRVVDFDQKTVRTLAGGNADHPQNLNAFGDKDGPGNMARLQRPLGIVALPHKKAIVIADTYNHCLKWFDVQKGTVKTFAGCKTAGKKDGIASDSQFSEPSGVALSPEGRRIFVADSNNHAIRVVDIQSRHVTTLRIDPKR